MSAVMVATDHEDARAYEYAERRIELCAFEVRRRERQLDAFFDEQHRVRVVNSTNDGAAVAVFHGTKQVSVRERMLAEYRREVEEEQRRKARDQLRRHTLALRRVTGVLHFCRHCNHQMFRGTPGNKCQRCKDDPLLVTARGTEKRSFVPHREAQPDVTPLSTSAERVLAAIAGLDLWMRESLELHYFEKLTELAAAEKTGVSVPAFAGYVRAGVTRVAMLLANPSFGA